jgi:uncharacterized protein (TIGR02569 family)
VTLLGASPGPSRSVVAAFGGSGEPERLRGGQGTSWRAGGIVLKPIDGPLEALAWQADELAAVPLDGLRLATPVRAGDGRLVVGGWTARRWLEGDHEHGRWLDVIVAGERLHRATATHPRPAFLDRRDDPWAVAERLAWGDLSTAGFQGRPHVVRLLRLRRPAVDAGPDQLIHADLTGNVLFSPDLGPAVIDFSPSWRPAGWASAIVVADALTWEGADASFVMAVSGMAALGQLLVRALLFRILAGAILGADDPRHDAAPSAYDRAVDLATALVEG